MPKDVTTRQLIHRAVVRNLVDAEKHDMEDGSRIALGMLKVTVSWSRLRDSNNLVVSVMVCV